MHGFSILYLLILSLAADTLIPAHLQPPRHLGPISGNITSPQSPLSPVTSGGGAADER